MAPRINFIDFLRGFTIIIVILYHITFFHSGTDEIRDYSTPFFMQLFFFSSGLFFSAKSSFKEYLKNKINRLIIPLLFFYTLNNAAGYIASDVLGLGDKGIIEKFQWNFLADIFNGQEKFHYSGAIWFLLCLFNVLIIYYAINKIKSPNIKLVISLIVSVIGFYINKWIDLPYFIDSAMSMTFFFAVGHYLKGSPIIFERKNTDYIILITSVILYIVLVNNFEIYSKVMQNEYKGNFVLVYLTALVGIAAVFYFSKRVRNLKIISFFGVNSLIVLGTHQVLINVVSVLLKSVLYLDHYAGALVNLVITLAIEYVIILLFSRFVPFFVAKKDLIK